MDITDFRFEDGDADYMDDIWFFRIFSQKPTLYFFYQKSLFLLKEVKPSRDHKMIKLRTFDTCFCY